MNYTCNLMSRGNMLTQLQLANIYNETVGKCFRTVKF